MMAVPVLDRGGAADRLRNHLRRRAITRVGLIEGDLYLLPFWRARGIGPEGETSFHVLGAEIGDARLTRANLPPANLKPFHPDAVPPGARWAAATLGEARVKQRAEAIGWRVEELEELIHYPFWLMRVEDSGRIEGGWIDGVEGKVIHHSLKVPPPVPSTRLLAAMTAVPAALMGAVALMVDSRIAAAAIAAVVAGVSVPVLTLSLDRRSRRERDG